MSSKVISSKSFERNMSRVTPLAPKPVSKTSMGPNTYEIDMDMYAENRQRLCSRLVKKDMNESIIFLQGGNEIRLYNTDTTYGHFQQEPFFLWAFGVTEPGCSGMIFTGNAYTTLFIERDNSVGMPQNTELFKEKYNVDCVAYVDEIFDMLSVDIPENILLLRGVNTDSGLPLEEADFESKASFNLNYTVLYEEFCDLRAIKTNFELDLLTYVNRVTNDAHEAVMKMVTPGLSVFKCEATFAHLCYTQGGCRFVSYACVKCVNQVPNIQTGYISATSERVLQNGDLFIFNMGANYFGYHSDVTCTLPVNGMFSIEQREIYAIVQTILNTILKLCRPGVTWLEVHNLGTRLLLSGLKDAYILKGNVDDLFQANIAHVFLPHGFGHLIGLDVHDVGAYLSSTPEKPTGKGMEMLQTARTLEEGMCLTVEPACYFIDVLLDEVLANSKKAKFFNLPILDKYRGLGGVRLGDNVYITDTGYVNMTSLPRDIDSIEHMMNSIGNRISRRRLSLM